MSTNNPFSGPMENTMGHDPCVANRAMDSEMMRNSKLFFEADRLDKAAYAILSEGDMSSLTLRRFSAAKKLANEKYNEAYQDWVRIRTMMSS